ncbi:MAG: hypothetical protein EP216_04060 [Epsilonproteobacteria bacterium]|nr:MAG: hypothetical protein EP216_04060 [Campylobacterota bacterium]
MIRSHTALFALSFLLGGYSESFAVDSTSLQQYIKHLEDENNISYTNIVNTRGSYIPSMCYTKTKDETANTVFNPCYSCHTKGKIPNYYNDSHLQTHYDFPSEMMKNPFTNMFKDRSAQVDKMRDKDILAYIRESNYFNGAGDIVPALDLPSKWKGYRPDC